jgi:hypothetical protein
MDQPKPAMKPDKEELLERIVRLVDDLERYKAAVAGKSDLEIGPATIIYAFDQCEHALLDARELLKG